MLATIAVEYAYQLSNKEITIFNQIYSVLYPRTSICSIARKPT